MVNQTIKMIVTVVVLKKILKNFFIEFPESEPVVFNDKFRSVSR